MKKTSFLSVLAFLSVVTLSGCGGGVDWGGIGGGQPGPSALLATGGEGFTGSGGTGGRLLIETTGWVTIWVSGSVDTTGVTSAITPSFGANPFVVSGGTTTVSNADAIVGGLYAKNGQLYQGDGDTKTADPVVTGLTVPAGETLILAATVKLPNDLLINGTITNDGSTGLSIDANIIDIERRGKITTSSTASDAAASDIHLGLGLTKQIVNRGTIEAKGAGSGNGGSIFMNADNLVIHEGSIDTSGGSSASSKGGDSGNLAIIVNGDIIMSGTLNINGGNGTDGIGGSAGTIALETDAMGAVLLNVTMSAKGGDSSGTAYSGGNGGNLSISSYNTGNTQVTSPGKISVSGRLDIRGGDGELNGGAGGSISVVSRGGNAGHKGIDVEFLGFPKVILNGGTGAIQGGNGSSPALSIQSFPPIEDDLIFYQYPTIRGRVIGNEAAIEAKGGDSSGTGGMGGSVEISGSMSNNPFKSWRPANEDKKWITGIGTAGDIDVSGGNGGDGGSAYNGTNGAVYFRADYVFNSCNFKARGGNGATTGGNGGNVNLFAYVYPTQNEGTADLAGGSGGTTSPGIFTIDGVPTN